MLKKWFRAQDFWAAGVFLDPWLPRLVLIHFGTPSGLPPCAFIPWAGPLGTARGSAQSGLVLPRQIQRLGRLPAAEEYGSPLIWGHVEYSPSARPALGSGDPAANKIDGTNHLFICPLKNPRSGQNGHPFYG